MHTETIAGLHKCQPKNAPKQGETKNMVVLNMPAKNGKKAWIKIKSEKPEKGGSPYRLLNVEKLDWPPDDYGNIAFNIEVEASSSAPSAFQQTKATMQQGETSHDETWDAMHGVKPPSNAPQSPPHAQQGEDGVQATRKHLMQACNLYSLCIGAVEKVIAGALPEAARTSEQLQASLASIWIEASSRRSTDGVTWWSFIDKMPTTPLAPSQSQQGKPRSTTPLSPKNVCTCENTDGDNPLCPVHSG